MPAKSKAQLRFMASVMSGKARMKHEGLSKEEAAEFVHASKGKDLPERVRKLAKKRKGKK